MLCRVFANIMDRKVSTGEIILGHAENLLYHITENKDLEIINFEYTRKESRVYLLETLWKKFYLNRGILYYSLNKLDEACDSFLKCMETGETFHPMIR